LTLPLDLQPVDFGSVGAPEVFYPVTTVCDRNACVRSRHPQIRAQVNVDMHPGARSTKNYCINRLVEGLLVASVAIAYAHVLPSGCSLHSIWMNVNGAANSGM